MEWFIYLLLINITSYLVMGYDKRQAIAKKRRVSEKNLFLLALIGGGVGMYIGMKEYRHKTKHRTFTAGIPIIITIQIIGVVFIILGR
ncbi:hypothetical protein BpOF4_03250 [Alkalihalophilus pseudofirmus OF4]|uniref:DUF1294 domain-containing protein n=2 Tax=Alkalihalophilus pseudofirmus TaxID=79885 RepID=D3FWI4_ALKPO|nr:DUF1294 domain-containing protein [Alkalihalophilus pseudofirmus]ADC48716.1 hypothetical protein BpOF4_03250 [Alkalihalophilus pseudofirmus OF4]MDV2885884.1 DUF1294 domain-containing protein [Alkalihalophilus pseudofirmus]